MKKPARLPKPSPAEKASRVRQIQFIKQGHVYTFRYTVGSEVELVCSLLNAAIDPAHTLSLDDARHLLTLHNIAHVTK